MTHCEYVPLSSLNSYKSEMVTALPQLYHPSVSTGVHQTVKSSMSLWCHSAFQSQHILEAVQQWHSNMCQGPISPDSHTWQHKVNYGSWWLLSSENSTQRFPSQISEPLLWEDQCWRAQSSSSTTSQLTNPSSLYTLLVWDAAQGSPPAWFLNM